MWKVDATLSLDSTIDNRRVSLHNRIVLPRGQIFFDASCGLCTEGYRRFGPMTERRGFRWVPLQDRRAQQILGLEDGALPEEVKLLTKKGQIVGGVDAMLYVARYVWWAWPAWVISCVPGVRWLLRFPYRWIARNRQRISGACHFDPSAPRPKQHSDLA